MTFALSARRMGRGRLASLMPIGCVPCGGRRSRPSNPRRGARPRLARNGFMLGAYIPCFNNAATIRRAVESVLAQTIAPAEVVVIDDGSSDDSTAQLAGLPARIVRHGENLGRGAARARGMRETTQELVLCCDATNVLDPSFAADALRHFEAPRVAAVYGRFEQAPATTVAERWRGRHLFKTDRMRDLARDGLLITSGAVVRRSSVEAVGGFDARLRHSEDAELGRRLLAAGYEVIGDPCLAVRSIARNNVSQVLERYWRWHAGADERVCWKTYLRNVSYATKAMAMSDLRARDPMAAIVSLICPHYQFWRSRMRARAHRRLAL